MFSFLNKKKEENGEATESLLEVGNSLLSFAKDAIENKDLKATIETVTEKSKALLDDPPAVIENALDAASELAAASDLASMAGTALEAVEAAEGVGTALEVVGTVAEIASL